MSYGLAVVFLLALEALPFFALAAVSTRMPWWLGITAATAFGALTDIGIKSIHNSTSSTAAVAIPFIPLFLLAACDVVALVSLRARGGTIQTPRPPCSGERLA